MDDVLGMGGVEGVGDLRGERNELVELNGAAVDAMLEGLALEQLHGDEGATVVLVNIVNGADVRVIQSRGGAGFALKTLERLSVGSESVGEEFERDAAAEAGVLGFVDDAHAATAEFAEDAIVRDGLADHG